MSTIISREQFWKRHGALKALHVDNAAFSKAAMALHREYWGAYVHAFKIKAVPSLIAGSRRALMAGDVHMNSPYTVLAHWDWQMPALGTVPGLVKTLRENGEGWSLGASVCILKEAMRQHLEIHGAYEAATVLGEIADKVAFNIGTATKRQKLNQHSTLYTFSDGSMLQINATKSRADAWFPGWQGTADDMHLRPIKGFALRINRQS